MCVSVVIPAYNPGALIDDAIASVLRQETPADEIIIVDDGSTDRNYRELEDRHHSIKVIRQSNRGVSAARNVGCDAATGSYIAVLDADDIWLPGKLEAQTRYAANHPQIDAIFCLGRQWTPETGNLRLTARSPSPQAPPPPRSERTSLFRLPLLILRSSVHHDGEEICMEIDRRL